jgi:hypothetical protein
VVVAVSPERTTQESDVFDVNPRVFQKVQVGIVCSFGSQYLQSLVELAAVKLVVACYPHDMGVALSHLV